MRVQCAWCGCNLGRKAPLDRGEVTHGICPSCMEDLLGDAAPGRAGPHEATQPPNARTDYFRADWRGLLASLPVAQF